jgi:DNA (cytosine-5)-methyltransferase 1
MELNVLDLFSGIGGFSVGLEATGKFKTVAFCEKDKFCQKVLQKHWQGTTIYEDIRDIDGTKIKADVVTGGFPCQPFSTAGKRKGTDDDRYLFPEMLRIIKETQARWIVGENVQGIVNMSEGKVLQGIHNDLEAIGYEVQTFIINASSQGAWHKRNRVWIIAANTNITRFKNRNEQHWGKQTQSEKGISSSSRQNIISNTNTRLSVRENEEVQARGNATNSICKSRKQTWWQTESKLCGVPDGISYGSHKDRVNRIKALGNAIVPQIATEIGKAIIKAEEEINEWN